MFRSINWGGPFTPAWGGPFIPVCPLPFLHFRDLCSASFYCLSPRKAFLRDSRFSWIYLGMRMYAVGCIQLYTCVFVEGRGQPLCHSSGAIYLNFAWSLSHCLSVHRAQEPSLCLPKHLIKSLHHGTSLLYGSWGANPAHAWKADTLPTEQSPQPCSYWF